MHRFLKDNMSSKLNHGKCPCTTGWAKSYRLGQSYRSISSTGWACAPDWEGAAWCIMMHDGWTIGFLFLFIKKHTLINCGSINMLASVLWCIDMLVLWCIKMLALWPSGLVNLLSILNPRDHVRNCKCGVIGDSINKFYLKHLLFGQHTLLSFSIPNTRNLESCWLGCECGLLILKKGVIRRQRFHHWRWSLEPAVMTQNPKIRREDVSDA